VAFYLVERYVPSVSTGELRVAIARINGSDGPARHLWTILVTAEDTCLTVFEAPDVEAVIEATADAGFPYDRVVEVTPVVDGTQGGRPETAAAAVERRELS
jgi:Nickel responsive protein SCO4226-like